MNSFIILLILLKITSCSKILSIPFKFKSIKSNYYTYNSSTFFNEYYNKELILEINIGTPFQKINAVLNPNSYCLILTASEPNYYPHKSSSFKVNPNNNPKNSYYIFTESSDVFNFNTNESYKLFFSTSDKLNISTNKNISLTPEIGINNPLAYYGYFYKCNNLIEDLQKKKTIQKKMFSVKMNDKWGGEFIMGDDLSKYDSNKFKEEKYYTKYFVYDFMFMYDNIYMKSPWDKTEYLNITGNTNKKQAVININSGLIIGTEEFEEYIYKSFFRYLVEKSTCIKDLVVLNQTTDNKNKLGNEFYIYSCNHMKFTGQDNAKYKTIDYYSKFPNITFNSKSFEYDFELTNKDLFEQIYSRDYFLVIFPKKIKDKADKDIWYLGQPFYKKYPFTINLDAKTIGFYLDKKDIQKKINDTKNNVDKNNKKGNDKIIMKDNNTKIKSILIKIVEILAVIGFIILAYFIGMKVKEGRKKRANELKDDSYEYISDDNKDINDIGTEQKNKQIVELNSKLGF